MSLESGLTNPPSLVGLVDYDSGEDAKEREPFFFEDDDDTQEYDPDFGKKMGNTEEIMEQSKQSLPPISDPKPPQIPEEAQAQPMDSEPTEANTQPMDSKPSESDTQPIESESQPLEQNPHEEQMSQGDAPAIKEDPFRQESPRQGSPKEKSSPEKDGGKGSRKRHRSHRSHRHSSRRHRHRSDDDGDRPRRSRRGRDSESREDGELEDGEIDDEPQGDDGPPKLSPQVPLKEGSKDAEMESEDDDRERSKSPDKKGDADSDDDMDDKKRSKKRKHDKRKKKKESRTKEKQGKKRRPKYTDHDNMDEESGPQEGWMKRSRSPNGHSYKGHDRYPPNRSPPGPYDSPYESPPGPYDSPSDEDSYGPPSKMMRRGSSKQRMMDMLGPEYMDQMDGDGGDEMYGRGRKMGRGKQKKMEKGRMFRDMQRPPGRMDKGGNMMGTSAQKCKFFMEGKCAKGQNCTFSHDFRPPRKTEVCKFYISDTCAKGNDCLYMHGDYPCKFFHKGMQCAGEKCKFSHAELDEHTGPIFDKIRDEDQDFVTVMLQQTNQLPYPMPGQTTRSPHKNQNRRGGGNFQGPPGHQQAPPQHFPQQQHQQQHPHPQQHQQQQQQMHMQQQHQQQMQHPPQHPPSHLDQDQSSNPDLKKIPSLFEIEVFPPPKSDDGEEGGSTPCPQSPSEDGDHMEGDGGKMLPRSHGRENSPPHHHQGPPQQSMGGPMGNHPPHPHMGGGMGGPPPGMMGGPPPNRMGGPPPPHMGGPPMGMRPRFYSDMNAPGRPPPPMMGPQQGILGAPPPMMRPPHMNFPHPGDGHMSGPGEFYGPGPGGEQQGPPDTILSPEPESHKGGDMFGLDDQLKEMREMSGKSEDGGVGGQAVFPAHLPAKQRELFMRIQNQQRKNLPEPAGGNQQGDKDEVDDDWYSSDEEESGPPKANLANILKKLNQKPPAQAPAPTGSAFDIAKVLNVISGGQPGSNQPQSRDPRQGMQAGAPRASDPRMQRSDPRTQRPDPRTEVRDQRPDPRMDHRSDPRMREPPTIPIEKTDSFRRGREDSAGGGDSRFNEAGIMIHSQVRGDVGGIPYQLTKMTLSHPTLPQHVNRNDPKYKEDPRIQCQQPGRGYQEPRPMRRQSSHSDPRSSLPQQQSAERYNPRMSHSPSHSPAGMRAQDPRMLKGGGGGGPPFRQDVDMRQERGRTQDPRMSRTLSQPFDAHNPSLHNQHPPPPQDMDMRPLRMPGLNSGARDSPPMPSLPPFIPPKPSAPLHKPHSSSPGQSPRGESGNSSSDTNDRMGEKALSHRNDPRFRKKPKGDSSGAASPPRNDPRQRSSDSRRAFEHRSPLDSGSKSVNEPSFGSFNTQKNARDMNEHGDRDERDFGRGERDFGRGERDFGRGERDFNRGERDFGRGSNGHPPRHPHPPRGPARHLGMPQISMPTRLSSLRPNSPNPTQLAQTGSMVRAGGPEVQPGLPDDDPNRSMKEVFKTIDPTASPFC